jgi:DNA ligase-1
MCPSHRAWPLEQKGKLMNLRIALPAKCPSLRAPYRPRWVALACALVLGGQTAQAQPTPALSAVASSAATSPALMLAGIWPGGRDPAGYLVSEKLDGVRAFWDGERLRFRSGLPIAAPGWFTAALPKVPLDGELWLGRGQFDRLSGVVRKELPVDAEWRELRYMVFDLPGSPGPFAQRVQGIESLLQVAGQPWLQAVAQVSVANTAALSAELKRLVAEDAEGLVLHRADALWSPGRSDALLKYKPVQDEDARVVGHLPGKGRHAGRMGALLLEQPDGQRFALGTGFSDEQRTSPPAIGTVVTYRYRGRTPKGLPRFASFLRERGPQ